MTDTPFRLKFTSAADKRTADSGSAQLQTVGVVEGVVGGADRITGLAALFPNIGFESLGSAWPDRVPLHVKILIAGVDAASVAELDQAARRLRAAPGGLQTIVVLKNADVASTRKLMQEGASDVLLDPVSEPALALSLERLLTRHQNYQPDGRRTGEVVAFLKAGGGVGATALAAQTAALLASRGGAEAGVCLADLDLQFGAAGFYLDIHDAVTISDCLGSGVTLSETPFASQLTAHKSGVRVLAAPRDLTPLEFITPPLVDNLYQGLRSNFALTIVDLPSVWTAWTNRALQLADRIVLVTQLSVPHIQLVRRQLGVFHTQLLNDKPLTLVCNALGAEQQASLSVKAAERAIGRDFDVVIPEDRKVMNAAINQGVLISEIKRKTKLEQGLHQLADKVAVQVTGGAAPRR